MGLFDKKYCDICGEKIGLLGNRKLADGNCCKECAGKLSPWFNERKASTIADIRSQLQAREENKQKVAVFHAGEPYGTRTKVYLDKAAGKFIVTNAAKWQNSNPDVLRLDQVTDCRVVINEDKNEMYGKGMKDEEIPYDPPQFSKSYDFYMEIELKHPYINQIRFKLNDDEVVVEPEIRAASAARTSASQTEPLKAIRVISSKPADPTSSEEYRNFDRMAKELRCALLGLAPEPEAKPETKVEEDPAPSIPPVTPAPAVTAAPAVEEWTCPGCGTTVAGKFCPECGTPKPVPKVNAEWTCPNCGTKTTGKFCPECGTRKPEESWTCRCGMVNKGKFCLECGAKRP